MAETFPPHVFIHPHVALARDVFQDVVPAIRDHSVEQLLDGLAQRLVQQSNESHPWVPILLKNWSPWRRYWESDQLEGLAIDLDEARLTIAREHGFDDWQAVLDNKTDSIDVAFEAAVDAVVGGHESQLLKLIEDEPNLINQRSSFGHRATLLHYVAANGVETRRQMAPANVASIVQVLVERGASPDAVCETYGGGSAQTPLCLAISSGHLVTAETIGDLIRSLCESGAQINGIDNDGLPLAIATASCNKAALEQLSMLGAQLDHPVTAAACGELDLIEQYLLGNLTFSPTPVSFPDEYQTTCQDLRVCLERMRRVASRFQRNAIVDYIDGISSQFSEILDRFDSSLANGEAADMASLIPSEWTGMLRKQLLADLCAIDLDYRSRQRADSKIPTVADYLAQFPELGPEESIPVPLLLEEYRIRTEAGELLSIDQFVANYPSQAPVMRPLLHSIVAEHQELLTGIQLHVYYQNELVLRHQVTRPVELGRQKQGDPEPYELINDQSCDRLVIASFRDRYVSRIHLRVATLPDGRVRVENRSKKNAVSVRSLATLLPPGKQLDCLLPMTIDLESRSIVIQRQSSVPSDTRT